MSDTLEYRGFVASVAYSIEDKCLYGKVEFINDLIMFDAVDAREIESVFHDAVDSYLAFCEEQDKEPNQTFKGSFNVRVGPDLHRKAVIAAKIKNVTLNELIIRSLETTVNDDQVVHKHEHVHIIKTEAHIAFSEDSPAITDIRPTFRSNGHHTSRPH